MSAVQEDAEYPPERVTGWCGTVLLPSLGRPASKSHTAPTRRVAVDIWVSRALRKAVSCTHKLWNCTDKTGESATIQSAIYERKNKLPLW